MSRIGWSKRSRKGAFPGLSDPPQGQGIHVYLFWSREGERYLSHTSGDVTAEELCISAGEAVGESDNLDQIHSHRPQLSDLYILFFFHVVFLSGFNLSVYSTGITPLCHVLFALYNPLSHCWYSPNHIFSPDEKSGLVLQYCMRLVSDCVTLNLKERPGMFTYVTMNCFLRRFYFQNWHGLNEKEPTVSRYVLRSGTDLGGSPLLDITSLEYLFSQVCI